MKKLVLSIGLCFTFLIFGCTEKDTTFLITEDSIGPLNKSTDISTLETIFNLDSIVRDSSNLNLGASTKKIKVFERGGKPLLLLTPNLDSLQTIENVQILDERYMSINGISKASTFKDIIANFEIKKVVTTINSVVIFPKESNLYFTIDKTELPSNLRYTKTSIEAVQIPDEAKIKYLMLGWD